MIIEKRMFRCWECLQYGYQPLERWPRLVHGFTLLCPKCATKKGLAKCPRFVPRTSEASSC